MSPSSQTAMSPTPLPSLPSSPPLPSTPGPGSDPTSPSGMQHKRLPSPPGVALTASDGPLSSSSSSGMGGHGRKTTIHVTNITMDRAKLQQHFRKFDGFKRISFHQDYVFVCFHQLEQAAAAIDRIHAEGGMLAAYAKHGVASGTQPSIVVPPNPILYVSVFPYFGEGELTTIFQQYEGFDSCRFFPTHVLVRFNSIEAAKRGLEDLNATTNLFANYSTKGAKNPENSKSRPRSDREPASDLTDGSVNATPQSHSRALSPSALPPNAKCTIHVTNLDQELATLWQTFRNLPGFSRVAFYSDYAFVIFTDPHSSSAAVEELLFHSRMKASFARAEYTPHIVPAGALGTPNAILRISDYPPGVPDSEIEAFLALFEGFLEVSFYHASCLAQFRDVDAAAAALQEINGTTNFTTIFSRKGAMAAAAAAASNAAVHSIQKLQANNLPKVGHGPHGYNHMYAGSPLPSLSPLPSAFQGAVTPVFVDDDHEKDGDPHARWKHIQGAGAGLSPLPDLAHSPRSPSASRISGQFPGMHTASPLRVTALSSRAPSSSGRMVLDEEDALHFRHNGFDDAEHGFRRPDSSLLHSRSNLTPQPDGFQSFHQQNNAGTPPPRMTPQPYNGSSAHQSPQNFLQQHLTGGGGNGNPDFSGPTGHSSSPLTQSWDLAQGAHIRAPKAEISSPGWGPAPLLSTSRQPSQLGFSPNAILESNDESLEARVRAASTLLDELYQRVVAQESVPPSDSLTATTPTATGASQLHDRLHPGAVGLGQDGAANAGRLRASSPLVAPMQRRHSVEPSSLFGPNSGSSVLFSPTPPAMSPSLSASPLPSLKGANPLTLQLRLQLAAQRAAGNNADSSRISSAATNASSSSSAGGSGTSPTSSATLQLPVGAGNSAASSPRQPSASVVEEFIVRVSAAGPGRLLRHLTDGHSNGIAAIGTGRPSSPALLSPPASASGTTSVSPTPTLLHHFLGGSGKRDDEEAAQDIPSTTGTLIDWRASCERAAAEVARLRAALAKREAEYERLEAAHKGCGYIENLLAICD